MAAEAFPQRLVTNEITRKARNGNKGTSQTLEAAPDKLCGAISENAGIITCLAFQGVNLVKIDVMEVPV